MSANYWIDQLSLQSHPEGGYFKETYRSPEQINTPSLNSQFPDGRSYSTAIYFLLRTNEFSAFHRIKSDELWHFYKGNALGIYIITLSGKLEIIKLGSHPEKGETFQAFVPAGCWFASKVLDVAPDAYALVGCTVSPGFDFADFEMAERAMLINEFPQHEETIISLT